MTDTPNQTADADTLATQCPKCCGTGSIIYLGAPSIVCIDCGGSGRVQGASRMAAENETAAPRRIQRKRAKGWRMPEGAVYVGRPTMWGNRWAVGVWSNTLGRHVATTEEAVELYRKLAWPDPHHMAWVRENLRGRDLACWCPIISHGAYIQCHADVLLSIANGIPVDEVICENTRRVMTDAEQNRRDNEP